MSSEEFVENSRCCICMSTQHACNGESTSSCQCVPLLHFCPICLSVENNADKRICVNCLQNMMSHTPANEQRQQRSEIAEYLKLKTNTIADFKIELANLTTAKIVLAAQFLKKSYLHAQERSILQFSLFLLLCPSSFLSVVSTDSQNIATQGLLVRTLIAKRWFAKSSTTTLLKASKEKFRCYENVNVDNVAFMQRLHLRDSSYVGSANYDQSFEDFISSEMQSATSSMGNQSANAGNDIVHNAFTEFHSLTPQALEEISNLVFANSNNVQNAQQEEPTTLERTTKSILCPMCRQSCVLQTYKQSNAEKQELQRLSSQSSSGTIVNDSDVDSSSWNIREAQRKMTMMFDSVKKDDQCQCCVHMTRNLIEGKRTPQEIYNAFTKESLYLLAMIFATFILIDRPFLCICILLAMMFSRAFVNYRTLMKGLDRKDSDGQIFNHCCIRYVETLEEVLTTSNSPGVFARALGNEAYVSEMGKRLNAMTLDMYYPISLVIELKHQTWAGGILDRFLQFLYAKDLSSERWSLIAQAIYIAARLLAQASLMCLVTYRMSICEHLFKQLSGAMLVLKSVADDCRFRLENASSFAASLIYLHKDIIAGDEDSSTWKFYSSADQSRLQAEIEANKKILFERVPNQNKISGERKLHHAQTLAETEYRKRSILSRTLDYLKTVKTTLISLNAATTISSIFFTHYPPEDKSESIRIKNMIFLVLGHCGRTNFDGLLLNTFLIKMLLAFAYASMHVNEHVAHKIAIGLVAYFRLELVLLFVRVLIPIIFQEVWRSSNISNSVDAVEVCNFYASNFYARHITSNESLRNKQAVFIDSIRVGKNVRTMLQAE